jgi:hypothetical protein
MTKFWTMQRRDGRMPRDQQGWRVAPAPDGRGTPDPPPPRPPHRSRPFVWFVLLLPAFNLISALLIRPGARPRVRVPCSPYFVSAVRHGQVASIATRRIPLLPPRTLAADLAARGATGSRIGSGTDRSRVRGAWRRPRMRREGKTDASSTSGCSSSERSRWRSRPPR